MLLGSLPTSAAEGQAEFPTPFRVLPPLPSLLFSPKLSWICRSLMSKRYSSTMFLDVLLRKATVFRAPGPQWSGNAAANRVTSQLPRLSALGFPCGLAVKNPPQEMQV